jgi:hypothetical protein
MADGDHTIQQEVMIGKQVNLQETVQISLEFPYNPRRRSELHVDKGQARQKLQPRQLRIIWTERTKQIFGLSLQTPTYVLP